MYMEAYGGATSVAEGIIKKALGSLAAKKELEESQKKKSIEGETQWSEQAVSEDGISPQSNEGGIGSKADPNVVKDMEKISSQKAIESLNAKIENLQSRNLYLEDRLGRLKLRK